MTSDSTHGEYHALFEPDGASFIPTPAARGPWRADALHGGAVCALFGRAFRREGWVLARMTMDFVGRVPSSPLRLQSGGTFESRRARREGLELWAVDRLVAKAEALLLLEREIDAFPPQPIIGRVHAPFEDETDEMKVRTGVAERLGYPSFVSHGIAIQRTQIDTERSSVAANWVKLLLPTVAGQSITAVERACAAADFANGGFSTLPFAEWTFVNLDLTVHLVRLPVDEWIAVTNNSVAASSGVGLGDAELFDLNGRIGGSSASLLVERR